MTMRFTTAALLDTEYSPPSTCWFDPITLVTGGIGLAELLGGGIGGGLLAGGIEGAALGAGVAGITGGDPGMGALTGGLTGGAVGGFGGPIGGALGIGDVGGSILAGTAAGGAGAALTGGNPLTGALTGGAGGAIAGLTGGVGQPGAEISAGTISPAPAAGSGGAGGSAAATAGLTPGGMAAPVSGDLTGAATGGTPMSDAGSVFGTGGMFGSQGPLFGTGADRSIAAGGPPLAPSAPGGGVASKAMGLVENNPGVLLAGGLLGANMLMGNEPSQAQTDLQRSAGEAGTMGRTLAAYQQSGTLPSGLQSIVDQQVDAAKASIVSQYGHLGLGGSTMMIDKLNQLKQQKSAEVAQFADSLAKQGVQWTGLSAQQMGQLLAAETAKDNAFSNALGMFAGGLSGMRGGGSKT